ncbi:hypothetical protein [Campylobacter sp. MIT 97-5078]|uniref:hypothetical protein n=2 Tax=Campylobacter sp. MIT 97-5078 TaxID=1548153 RepID=UPI0021AF00DB|nr:hypothetical protein [Campylobacter sp. MIT 97-5078]
MMITLSSFNRCFGNNPLETLTKIRDEGIQNGNPELTREARETLGNSFITVYKYYEKLSDKVGLLEGSIEDKLRKNELSESETKSLFKWIDENTTTHWMEIDGVSYDEAYTEVFHTSKSIDEFKTKYRELQQKYLFNFNSNNSSQKKPQEQVHKELQDNNQNASVNSTSITKDNQANQTQETKPFKPIQGESKNKETYKDDNIRSEFLKKLLEDKFSTSEELKILFGMKTSDDDTSNDNFRKIISQMGLNNIKGIDIRA